MRVPVPSSFPIGSGSNGSQGRGRQPQWISDVEGNLIDLPGRLFAALVFCSVITFLLLTSSCSTSPAGFSDGTEDR
jgi:hypothetical protein